MLKQQFLGKVSVEVHEKTRQFFANLDLENLHYSLCPASSRDEIYQRIFRYLSELSLVVEANNAENASRSDGV